MFPAKHSLLSSCFLLQSLCDLNVSMPCRNPNRICSSLGGAYARKITIRFVTLVRVLGLWASTAVVAGAIVVALSASDKQVILDFLRSL